jgi:hypothetical protein
LIQSYFLVNRIIVNSGQSLESFMFVVLRGVV